MDMTRQSSTLSNSVEVVAQHSSGSMQTCSELIEDLESTSIVPGYEAEWAKSEYSEINQEYVGPVAVYMEEFFFTKPAHISGMTIVFQIYQDPCKSDHVRNFYQILLLSLLMNMVKRNERTHILEQFLDWLHWHYCIV